MNKSLFWGCLRYSSVISLALSLWIFSALSSEPVVEAVGMVFGLVFTVGFMVSYTSEFNLQKEMWDIELEKARIELRLMEHRLPERSNMIQTFDNPNRSLNIDKVPPVRFIERVWGSGKIPTEDVLISEFGVQADSWLNSLANLGFIEGRGAHGRSGVRRGNIEEVLAHIYPSALQEGVLGGEEE